MQRKDVLRIVLWDQLSEKISSLADLDYKNDVVVFLETLAECTNVNHHVKKLAFLFSSMRHFSKEIEESGAHVVYVDINEKEKSLTTALQKIIKKFSFQKIVITEPGDYRVLEEVNAFEEKLKLPVEIRLDDRFFCTKEEFKDFAKGRKKLIMENFYQYLRKKTELLMTDKGEPMGGDWNYDKENRSPPNPKASYKDPIEIEPDAITKAALKDVKHHFPKHFGDLLPFWFATTRKDAEKVFLHFLHHLLPDFGRYQDAMTSEHAFLHHSVISHYLNVGLLCPKKVCQMVHDAYVKNKIPIQSAEGYIRQILGWREYVRGVYSLYMPEYAERNYLHAKRKLPWFYWTGDTEMNCLKQVISQTKQHAYSHHIQRLMITGNFALLIGVLPNEICDWYLAVYADAHDWVEMPNTLGMSQFADGGVLGTKPYASSGSYINKMSNFCKDCKYNVKEKEGENACPFNYLYWDFLMRNHKVLQKNVRLAMPYKTIEKFSAEKKKQIHKDATKFLNSLEE